MWWVSGVSAVRWRLDRGYRSKEERRLSFPLSPLFSTMITDAMHQPLTHHSKSTSCLGIRRSVEGLGNRCKKFVGQAAKDRTT